MAHLLLELRERLRIVALAGERDYELPVTQEVLADLLGLSIVHVNRTLRRFEREGLIAREGGFIILKKLATLTDIADFESGYLSQKKIPEKKRSRLMRTP